MSDAGRRPMGRLFYWLLVAMMATGAERATLGRTTDAGDPPTTTIADTIYLADGSAAQGSLIITWPAFVTASGAAIAGGVNHATLGANGALNVALVPNEGATPAGVYYTVVFQLGPGQIRTEYWVVPKTSPANLASVRTTPGSGIAGQPVSLQYVNSGLAGKANDSDVVHLDGSETITGAKTFSAAPNVPAPTSTGQVANKAYVDQSVSNVGAGSFLPTVGGTMSGPITLPGNPAAALQAVPKQYVDQGFSGKADLVSGVVPASELGAGTATAGTCLLGNATWGTCGSGPTGVANGSALVSNGVAAPPVYQTKGIADVADYPAVIADGTTDNCTSFQAFIDANPGKRLLVRKVAAATKGGNQYSTVDYYSSCTFHLKYNGTVIEGNGNEMWQGAPVFLFAAGVTGFQIDPSCMGCGLKDLEEIGTGKPWPNGGACYSSGNALVYPFTGASDGVLVYGGEPTIERVEANCNQRDGIHIDGTNVVIDGYAGQPDSWHVNGGQGTGNWHNNLYIHGGDSNAGLEMRFMAYGAGGWGIEDDANFGNTHISSFTTSNGRDAGIAAKATSNISSISCTSSTCNVVTTTAVAGIQNRIWVVIAGTTNYNGVYYVSGYTNTTHFSFTRVGPSVGAESSGTVGVDGSTHMFANATRTVGDAACPAGQTTVTAQSAHFGKDTQPGAAISVAGAGSSGGVLSTTISSVINEYAVQLATNCVTGVTNAQASYGGGISHGPYFSNTTAIANTWITPYWEGDQPKSKMTSANLITGGDMSFDYSWGVPQWWTVNDALISQSLQLVDPKNTSGFFQIQCGESAYQDCGMAIFDYAGANRWQIYAVGSSADQSLWIRDEAAGGIIPFATAHGSTTDISAATNLTLNPGSGSSVIVNGKLSATGAVTIPAPTLSNVTGSTQCLHVNGAGLVSGSGADCGSGGGSGTVNAGTAQQVAMYAGDGSAVSGDSGLTDNGTVLNYLGSGGIAATAGTFSGNLTVNGQLLVAGPWTVSSPVPGTAMAAAGAGTSALGISNDGNFYVSANGGSPVKVATTATSSYFSNLFQEDANSISVFNGINAEGLNVYGTRTDASNYERLALAYDTTNTNYFKIDAQAAGSGTKRGLAFWVNGAARWGIDQTDMLKPFQDNLYDLGSSSFHVRNGYFGTGVVSPSITLAGHALSDVIGTPTATLISAGVVSGTGAPVCTDGTGNLTLTTVGCPPGTGTIGGSGAISQFAYWTNTNGLGAAPFYLNGANTVEQYNGTNVQIFNVYGTRTDASNYERLAFGYDTVNPSYFKIDAQAGGTGVKRGLAFWVNGAARWAIDQLDMLKPIVDNAYDLGSSSMRVRDFYLGRSLIMSGTATTYNGKATAGTGLAPVYGAVASTGLSAAVGSTAICASATCGAGQYVVNYYLDSTLSCTTPGSAAAALTIGWTDEIGAKTQQAPLSGTGISGGNSMALGNATNFGNGSITFWSAGGANITYSTSYTACTSGTGTYALRVVVRQLQ